MIKVFIATMAITVWLFCRALRKSWNREKEGASVSRALFLAQEKERRRIARALHDSVAQDICCLSLQMGKIADASVEEERKMLHEESLTAQEDLIRQIREICNGLVPPDFQFMGLPDVLNRLCHDFGARTGIRCYIDVEDGLFFKPLDEEKQLQCFRIVQEALSNVEQHARAEEAFVVIRNMNGRRRGGRRRSGGKKQGPPTGLFLSVSDDGVGFDVSRKRREGLGIKCMSERAAMLEGRLVIESTKGEGTMVWAEVPFSASGGSNHDKNHAD